MEKVCVNCDIPLDLEDLADALINGKTELCQECKEPRTCENGDAGDRCAGGARHLGEQLIELRSNE